MPRELANPGPPIDEADLEKFEQKTGCKVPEAYRSFLLTTNGGQPERRAFTFRWKDGRPSSSAVRNFFGLYRGGDSDLEGAIRTYVDSHRVPPDMFPIADDEGGNLVLLGASGPRSGQVYFWDHNWEADECDPPTEENMHLVTRSFEGFISALALPGE